MKSPKSKKSKQNTIINIVLIFLIIILTTCVFLLTMLADNKYSISEDNGQVFYQDNKLTLLSKNSLDTLIPVLNWNYYDGLIDPEDMDDSVHKPKLITIGDYSNFDTNDVHKNVGTYRATIYSYTEDEYISIQLYLPEVLSSCKIFADGVLLQEMGTVSENKEEYSPYIQNQNITITFKHSTDIVIQVANFSHYYGGIYYPPIISGVPTMLTYMSTINVIYSLIFSIAILVGLSCLFTYIFKKDKTYLWASLLSLSFAMYIFYPIFHMMGSHVIGLMYALENIGMVAISIFMLLISTHLMKKNVQVKAINTILIIASITTIVFLSFLNLTPEINNFFQIFSIIVRFLTAIYLLILAVINVIREDKMMIILVASIIYSTGIIFDIFVASYYDPYYFLYPNETGTFISIILFLILTLKYTIKTETENKKLNTNLVMEVAIRTDKMRNLISERRDFVSSVAHDLKSPISSLKLFINKLQSEELTQKEREKIYEVMDDKINNLTENLTIVQNFNNLDLMKDNFEKVELNAFLKNIYEQFLPEAEAEGIHFKQKISNKNKLFATITPHKFERAIENILFNALSFTSEGGHIVITLKSNSKQAIIEIQDDGQGMTQEVQEHVFDKFFTYREHKNSTAFSSDGLGMYYTKLVVDECGGDISVQSRYEVGTTFIITLPLSN